MAEHITYEEGA